MLCLNILISLTVLGPSGGRVLVFGSTDGGLAVGCVVLSVDVGLRGGLAPLWSSYLLSCSPFQLLWW